MGTAKLNALRKLKSEINKLIDNELRAPSDMRYWTCIIGSVDLSEIPYGGDSPMRVATEKAYKELIGKDNDYFSSSWCCNEARKSLIVEATHRNMRH